MRDLQRPPWRIAMQSDFFDRLSRLREIMEVNRETIWELRESTKAIRAESERLIRSSRALLVKTGIREPERPQ
jgi:hypothetical protein